MPRPTRKRLKFDEDSVNNLLQEIYDDSHNQKAKIARLFTKWEIKIKENSEVAAIGDQIVKLIAAEAKNVDQKIMILRYLKEVVFEDNKPGNSGPKSEDEKNLSAERKNELLKMVEEGLEKKDRESKREQ
jgi:hypothetical protein